jgi:hypothetical protein
MTYTPTTGELSELLKTLTPAAREANHFYAVTNIRRHLEEIEKLRVYLKEPYEHR